MKRTFGSIREVSENYYVVGVEMLPDKEGKRRRKTKTIRGTYADAEKELTLLYARYNGSKAEKMSGMTINEFVENVFLPDMAERVEAGTLAATTYNGYEGKLRMYVCPPPFGSMRLEDLGPRLVKQHFQTLKTSPGACRSAWVTFRVAINYATFECELIERDPLPKRINLPRQDPYVPETYSAEELTSVLKAFKWHKLEPWLIITAATGLRRAESCALWWRDIDLETGIVNIRCGLQRINGKLVEVGTKTKYSNRVVVIPEVFLKRLREIVASSDSVKMQYQVLPLVPDHYRPYNRCCPNSVSQLYKRACEKLGLKHVPPKNLRHTCATILKLAGVDSFTIAKMFGWTTPTMLYSNYAQGQPDMAKAGARAIDTVMSSMA